MINAYLQGLGTGIIIMSMLPTLYYNDPKVGLWYLAIGSVIKIADFLWRDKK